jgi:adenylylsulfate kinase
MASTDFYEIYVNTPIEVCEQRDPKGLYQKARAGELKGFTGVDDPYEAPLNPELELDASERSADELADEVIFFLKTKGVIG